MGAVVSYNRKIGQNDFIAEFKWLHAFEVERLAEGDTLFLQTLMNL